MWLKKQRKIKIEVIKSFFEVKFMMNKDIKQIAMEQSAIDLNCKIEDFIQQKNKVVISKMNEGRKSYFKQPHFCQLACYGNSLVAAVDKQIEGYMTSYANNYIGFRCLDMPQLNLLNVEFNRYGKCVGIMTEYFLPDTTKIIEVNPDFDVKIFINDEITNLYDDDRFHMALSYTCESEKRDVIAVVGYKNKEIIGIAGASNDCATMWQVGIDVIPDYRKKGVASVLTKVITNEILKQGIVPFYGTAWSNIASKNTAINSGYKAAWVELAAIDIRNAMGMIDCS
jgi:GNAT superfamily N-acetyltransferase